MASHIFHSLAALLLSLAVLLPSHRGARAQAEKPLLVVVANTTGMTDITTALLYRVFTGYPVEYKPGKRLLPLNQPTGAPARQRFDRRVLGLAPDEVGRFWVDQRVRGASQPPRTVATDELALRVVAAFPGAITYTSADRLKPGLSALTIDGKPPSDHGYLLSR